MLHRIRSFFRALVRRDEARLEIDAEMAFHLEQLAEDLMRSGMAPDDARREARRRFGSVEHVHDGARRAVGMASLDEVRRNVRFAFRTLGRNPALTGAFVVTLGLCIGFGTAVFGVVDSVLWRPLPYPAADRLAMAGVHDPEQGPLAGRVGIDGTSWELLRGAFEDLPMAVYSGWVTGVNFSADGDARFVRQQRVSAGFFSTLGVEPLLGRGFTPSEDVPQGPSLAVLSHQLWLDTFGGDPGALGASVRLKGELHTVVGVMPSSFRSDTEVDVWTPLRASTRGEGGGANFTAIVRLPAGMSWDEARTRFASVEPSGERSELRFGIVPLDQALTSGTRLPLLVLLFAAGLMILVGFANLASVQVSRALGREVEMATRRALGSGVDALVRQLVTESLILGLLGGALGLAVSTVTVSALAELLRTSLGLSVSPALDPRALLAALALTGFATVFFGLAPLLQVSRANGLQLLVSGARGIAGGVGRRLRRLLLVGEVALVTVLLFAGILLARSYGHLIGLEPGFDASGVVTAQLSLDDARFAEPQAITRLFERSLEDLHALPGVSHAAVALSLPYERPLNIPVRLEEDQEGDPVRLTNLVYVTPEFFDALRIPVLEGRGFDERDGAEAPTVAIANRSFVETYMTGHAPVGSRVRANDLASEGLEVVGVVGDVQQASGGWGASEPLWAAPTLYVPAAQVQGPLLTQIHVWFSPSWVVRAEAVTPRLAGQVARVFESQERELPVARSIPMAEVVSRAFAPTRFQAGFLLVVAAFALLLAAVGLYGIVSNEVVQSRREMGLRMALGVTPRHAVWTTGLSGMRLAAWGLAVGAVGAVLVGRVLAGVIWGVSATDPMAVTLLVVGVGGLAAVASFVPALRIGRLDPAAILRE